MRLYAHKHKSELCSSSAVISNEKCTWIQVSDIFSKIHVLRNFRQILLSWTAYSADPRSSSNKVEWKVGNIYFNHSNFVMTSFCFKNALSITPLVCKLGWLRNWWGEGGRNLWHCRQSAIQPVCSQNNRMFLLLINLGLHIFPWNDIRRDTRPCCSSAKQGLSLRYQRQ